MISREVMQLFLQLINSNAMLDVVAYDVRKVDKNIDLILQHELIYLYSTKCYE